MFRNNVSDKFGVGSVVEGGPDEKWLVVGADKRYSYLLDMNTFKLSGASAYVVDNEHLTEEEARKLINSLGNNYTFSDYTLNAKGMKK